MEKLAKSEDEMRRATLTYSKVNQVSRTKLS